MCWIDTFQTQSYFIYIYMNFIMECWELQMNMIQ